MACFRRCRPWTAIYHRCYIPSRSEPMAANEPTLSLILPVFNEEAVIPELASRLEQWLAGLGESWEVLFVNDGSSDQSYAMLHELAQREPRYKIISFSRNFGHQA